MRNEINLQDRMLSALRQQAQNITVFLTNGFQMRGIVRGFDSFVDDFGEQTENSK